MTQIDLPLILPIADIKISRLSTRERSQNTFMDWGTQVAKETANIGQIDQIEYLLFQSAQGLHFIFDHSNVSDVLRRTEGELEATKADKVQSLLSKLLDRKSMVEKRSYIESLAKDDYELLVRAYFQLVDKTILAHSTLKH
jgi:hypothetical protein